jgi:hypothetical protein
MQIKGHRYAFQVCHIHSCTELGLGTNLKLGGGVFACRAAATKEMTNFDHEKAPGAIKSSTGVAKILTRVRVPVISLANGKSGDVWWATCPRGQNLITGAINLHVISKAASARAESD